MQTTNHTCPRRGSRALPRLAAILAMLLLSLTLVTGVTAQDSTIVSTQTGEVPTTGGLRPGPVSAVSTLAAPQVGAIPKSIRIPDAQVDAQVEQIDIVNGVMQDPTGPWVVSWYKETAKLGQSGNVVMAGHVDYWNVGPSVFQNVKDLKSGDSISITGADGKVYTYAVDWNKLYNADADAQTIQDIVGATPGQNLTLITCGGTFNYDTGHYLQRRVVRAHRVTS